MSVADTQLLDSPEEVQTERRFLRKGWLARGALSVVLLLLVAVAIGWTARERIAANVIDDALAQSNLEADYDIVEIGTNRQIIENLTIGDPNSPDATIKRLVVDIDYGWLTAGISNVEVNGARVFGSYLDGELSFGALDPVLFADSEEPFEWPAFPIRIDDARGWIDSDYGAIGIKFDGKGVLADSFAGTLAATAPGLSVEGCRAEKATIYGDVIFEDRAPSFAGPLRLRGGQCEGFKLASLDIATQVSTDDQFNGLEAEFGVSAEELAGFEAEAASLGGDARLSWREGELALQHDLTARDVTTPYGDFADINADGILRAAGSPTSSQWNGRIAGGGVSFPLDQASALTDARVAVAGTLAEPLLEKLSLNLARAANGGTFVADAVVRQSEDATTWIVPEAQLRSSAGEALASISRLTFASSGRLTGNIVTGGEGLPRIAGRMERDSSGELFMRASMQEYAAGSSRLAVPKMEIRQGTQGTLAFSGEVAASGAIPGGAIEGLRVPLKGAWSSAGGLAIGDECTAVQYSRVAYYDLTIDGGSTRLCPDAGRPILAYGDELRVGFSTADLALSGEIAAAPLLVEAENASFAYPGTFTVEGLSTRIGPTGNAVNLTAPILSGGFDGVIGGEFSEATAMIDSVPLNFDEIAGKWRIEDYVLLVDETAFRVVERTPSVQPSRFEPLFAQDATLTIDENLLTVNADMREPKLNRLIASVDVQHDLYTEVGTADIKVPGIVFDDQLQPDELTYLTIGVIADVKGEVRGTGKIDWDALTLSSGGTFSTKDASLAAAFGPASGISGEIQFIDLLGMTTAPNQKLFVGTINPGIEVLAGEVNYELVVGETLEVQRAEWPFMGGTLALKPLDLNLLDQGSQLYEFTVDNLDAAQFIAQMEMTNIGATGTFNGTIPIVFDAFGNGEIKGGKLTSNAPGGNVAYIGELTYQDMGAISNYAFESLRSLDYTSMQIELNGSLAGEIITKFQFAGVRQGAGASSNFITRQLADLPIRFNVNVRSQNFYQLATMVLSISDPSYLGNPIDKGLLRAKDGRFAPATTLGGVPNAQPADENPPPQEDAAPDARRPDELPVQPPESEDLP